MLSVLALITIVINDESVVLAIESIPKKVEKRQLLPSLKEQSKVTKHGENT
jgi:hypothetical protein